MPNNLHPAFHTPKAVLFDFDYTLADSSAGIFASFNYALSRMGLDEATHEEIQPTIGLYLPEALVAIRGEETRPRGEEFLAYFTDKADEVMADGTFFLPGAALVLETLHKRGAIIGIVSTKYRYRIRSILERDGLNDMVAVVIGGEDVERHKPAPEGLHKAASQLGVPPVGLHLRRRQRGGRPSRPRRARALRSRPNGKFAARAVPNLPPPRHTG